MSRLLKPRVHTPVPSGSFGVGGLQTYGVKFIILLFIIPKAQLNNPRVLKVSHLQRLFLDFLDAFQRRTLTGSDPGLPTSRTEPSSAVVEGRGIEGGGSGGGDGRGFLSCFSHHRARLRLASRHLRPERPPS